jgi:hypothetical protein
MAEATVKVPAKKVTPVQSPDSWGPYADYTLVTTAWGEYGVPAGQIMTFEIRKVKNLKSGEIEDRPMPQYQIVDIDDPRLEPRKV